MNMQGQKGELGFTITIKRKDGTEETHELIGKVTDEESHKKLKEKDNGRNS